MLKEHIASQIYDKFAFTPTLGQKKIIDSLAEWISDDDFERIYILNGYAGTGKTTLIAAFVKVLKELKIKPILLAPTGRAAKVMTLIAEDTPAHTIHKRIYRERTAGGFDSKFDINFNREKDTVFIIDEASMIADFSDEGSLFGSGSLLDDLFEYVRSGQRCRLMFVGDSAQLPPVGHELSPALDPRKISYYGSVSYNTLDEVVRQEEQSGILYNATMVREMIENRIYDTPLLDLSFPDFKAISGADFLGKVEECYSRYGKDDVIVITRSNKRAVHFNQGIRGRVLFAEEEIESGDMLMVVKNNYHYTERDEEAKASFIANGDVACLRRIRRFKELYGFRFAEATLRFPDYDDYEVECNILLDALGSFSPSLTRDQMKELFYAVEADYSDVKCKAKRMKEVRENEYYNAMQVKFAYAVTCHKAQGGQWSAVFIDRLLFGEERMTREFLRWLYTAISRATSEVYLVNFDESFFDPTTYEKED